MNEYITKIKFLVYILLKLITKQNKNCPYCNSKNVKVLDRKKILLSLIQCSDCSLKYRYPKDSSVTSESFYNTSYKQGSTTDLPNKDDLRMLKENNFLSNNDEYSDLNISHKISIIKSYKNSGKLLDFGSSWGYCTYQFVNSGYDAFGLEISKERARFGRGNLNIKIFNDYSELYKLPEKSIDIIFANHVLEHITDLNPVFRLFKFLLKDGGFVFIFVPNGDGQSARKLKANWGPLIGQKHNLALDASFFKKNNIFSETIFSSSDNYIKFTNNPVDEILQGDELLAIFKN